MTGLSRAAQRFPAEGLVEFMMRAHALEAQGRSIVHLEIGEPDFDTPAPVTAAAKRALDDGLTHYTPVPGIPALRAAVAAHVSSSRHLPIPYDADDVVIGPGAKPLLWNLLGTLLDPGDDLVFFSPAYSVYSAAAAYIGARPVPVPLREATGWRPDIDALADGIGPHTKVLLLNSPGNPTGGVLTREDVRAIAALAERHDLWVISDEIYSRTVYGADAPSIAAVPGMRERTIVVDGFSKAYAMTGWRLGYAVAPRPIAHMMTLFANNTYQCVPAFTQLAGVAALEGSDAPVQAMCATLRERRDRIVAGLNALPGIRCALPGGAFYAFPNVAGVADDDLHFARYLLETAGVATLPGSTFGREGCGHLRLSYATSMENIELALTRLGTALGTYDRP